MTRSKIVLIFVFLIACYNVPRAFGTEIYSDLPSKVDPDQKYLFYMHGLWIEMHGLNQAHPKHGFYKYDAITQALAQKGFNVISELRLAEVDMRSYAEKIAARVKRLIEKGVPPEQITVAGHSKGGHLSLIVASLVQEPKLNVVILAGCGKPGSRFRRTYNQFLSTSAAKLKGHILSIYDSSDREAGSCGEAFQQSPEVQSQEIVLHTGKGHGLFYKPDPRWVEEIVRWGS